jgi:hypothetical protein
MCQPQCQSGSYTTTVCWPATTCGPITTCISVTDCEYGDTCITSATCPPITTCISVTDCEYGETCTTSATCIPSTTCELVTTCTTDVVTGCESSDPPATSDYYGYTSVQQEQPYTTITSGTIVYVVMPSAGAAAGQETNGIVQIASAAERFRDHDGSLMANGFALAVIMLALVLL